MSDTDPTEIPTLIVAVVGAATGITSLIWQIASRRRGGHRVKLEVRRETHVRTGKDGPSVTFVSLIAYNSGSAAVTIEWAGLEAGNGRFSSNNRDDGGARPPVRLEAGNSLRFLQREDTAQRFLRTDEKVYGVVALGSGESVRTRYRFPERLAYDPNAASPDTIASPESGES